MLKYIPLFLVLFAFRPPCCGEYILDSTDAVFEGVVLRITEANDTTADRVITFRVEKNIQEAGSSDTINVLTPAIHHGKTWIAFHEKRKYLVYTKPYKGMLYTGGCMPTRQISN